MIKKIKIGLIQSKSLGTIQSNIDLAIKNIKKAAKKKAKIICLPELFLTNYFCQTESHSNFKFAEKIPGKTSKIFSDLSKELNVLETICVVDNAGFPIKMESMDGARVAGPQIS